MNKKLHLTFMLLFVLFVADSAAAAPDWRTPGPDDLGQESEWRDEDINRYLVVRADFDGDGKEDVARLLINDNDDTIGLFVVMGSGKKARHFLLDTIRGKRMLDAFGVGLVKPGSYKTACGKGYWDCKKGEPEQVHLKNPGIDFFKDESANSFFVWSANKKTFERIWISD